MKRFARNHAYKLYQDGRMYHIPSDELEKRQLTPNQIDAERATIRAQLKTVIDTIYGEEREFPYQRDKAAPQKSKRTTP